MLDFIASPINLQNGSEDDIVNIRYKPLGIGLGDCCFASDEDGLHCFYIVRDESLKPDCSAEGQEVAIGHGVGKDIFSMNQITDAIDIRQRCNDCSHIWAPSVVYNNGKWHMFYTAVKDEYQTIAVAHSDDLYNWNRHNKNTVIDCGVFYWALSDKNGYTNCRDPYVTYLSGTWYCYYTAMNTNGNACVGVCTSNNLVKWHDRGTCLERIWQNGEGAGTELCESPCVFMKDGLYYLVYSQGLGLKYAVSYDPLDFSASPIMVLHPGSLPNNVPYNFELLDINTGLFGYLCGGYYSLAAFGFCDIDNGKLRIRKINTIAK